MSLEQEYFTETVVMPARIRPEQFGVTKPFFEQYIKGQKLKVSHIHGPYTYVEVQGELFSIHQDDLLPDNHDAERKEHHRNKVREKHGSYKGY